MKKTLYFYVFYKYIYIYFSIFYIYIYKTLYFSLVNCQICRSIYFIFAVEKITKNKCRSLIKQKREHFSIYLFQGSNLQEKISANSSGRSRDACGIRKNNPLVHRTTFFI